jgi:hypothetical protein
MFGHEWAGIDNIITGSVGTMYKLIHHFHFHLDTIEREHEDGKFLCPTSSWYFARTTSCSDKSIIKKVLLYFSLQNGFKTECALLFI